MKKSYGGSKKGSYKTKQKMYDKGSTAGKINENKTRKQRMLDRITGGR